MKAIGYNQSLPISEKASLVDIELPQPKASGYDLLVRVKSIAVNPVDYKIRQNVKPKENEYKVLGWDTAGEVVAIGESVSKFKPGDMVFYAGDLNRQGGNAQYQSVDERIVGHKPKSLSNSEAAALPLTAITAWELLFERLAIKQQHPDSKERSKDVILIVGAAGGVGSILVQLANVLTGATVIATASRENSAKWVKTLGADYVIDHSKPLQNQIEQLNIGQVTHIASLTHTDSYLDSYVALLAPMGKIALIDDPKSLDISKLKLKSLSLHWEFMFTRSMFNTSDIIKQHHLLNKVSDLIDQGYIQTTVGKNLGTINAKNLKAAHEILESGKSIGKIVLQGF
ncbi:zinc-binding alcohol dehydrogenase family protein [Pseudoalteromonas denitrificans]|jgi:zinc-binding alcohol dehydrogenase family protein|uniref:Zinc-type alcohol dehydrogenase-like protein n=1 Tax=Pseudoalteromonas denitrificans DSM 6059 TaxID=1123010 RepID=A0A1I1R2Z3_9GAMM|nr:zinc-binding alcohol dehydrogenase family protein [Pseudoalteromonas denitrificans]SFD25913.1 zinc-binding alcohol dehydrogenase family protein [Pseudoalteromonas denitrificans DSM 6059]